MYPEHSTKKQRQRQKEKKATTSLSFQLFQKRRCEREPAGIGKYRDRVNWSQSFKGRGGTNGGDEVLKRRRRKTMGKHKIRTKS